MVGGEGCVWLSKLLDTFVAVPNTKRTKSNTVFSSTTWVKGNLARIPRIQKSFYLKRIYQESLSKNLLILGEKNWDNWKWVWCNNCCLHRSYMVCCFLTWNIWKWHTTKKEFYDICWCAYRANFYLEQSHSVKHPPYM